MQCKFNLFKNKISQEKRKRNYLWSRKGNCCPLWTKRVVDFHNCLLRTWMPQFIYKLKEKRRKVGSIWGFGERSSEVRKDAYYHKLEQLTRVLSRLPHLVGIIDTHFKTKSDIWREKSLALEMVMFSGTSISLSIFSSTSFGNWIIKTLKRIVVQVNCSSKL